MDPPIKWHGGKHYLASRIVTMMPPHVHYVEPYAGGLSVLFAKSPEGVSEVVNDLDGGLANFWKVLRYPEFFLEFVRVVTATPFSEDEFRKYEHYPLGHLNEEECDVTSAVALFVRCRQSLAGRMQAFTPLSRTRTRRGMNEQVSAWLTAVEGLPAVHARLKRVVILNRDALDVIRSQDGPDTLFYCDPPYLHETRVSTSVYAHEMTAEGHRDLLDVLTAVRGRFILSGYPNAMYEAAAAAAGWHRTDFDLPNNAAGGEAKRRMTECLWTNFAPGPFPVAR